jgi:hypothetical protein
MPGQKFKNLFSGFFVNAESFGPFRIYDANLSIGVAMSNTSNKGGFYLSISPGIHAVNTNQGNLVWQEAEPGIYGYETKLSQSLAYTAGFWFSTDHKRNCFQYQFSSFDVLRKEPQFQLLKNILSGNHLAQWSKIYENSRSIVAYDLSYYGFGPLQHRLSYLFYTPYKIYGGLNFNSDMKLGAVLGFQLTFNNNRNSMLDIQYSVTQSLALFGNQTGHDHYISLKYLCNLID